VALYRTPRVYLDATTLCDPEDLRYTVHTDDIAAAFRAKGPQRAHQRGREAPVD
jgi:hypothetical protein